METLTDRLMAKGWRMTAQRRVIFGVFDQPEQHGDHPGQPGDHPGLHSGATHRDLHLTADEVMDRAVARLPEISRATVYNTLGELVDAGELLAVQVGDRVTRYDPNVNNEHHHVVCTVCGRIFDLPAAAVALPVGPGGFTIFSAEVIYRGRCADCRPAPTDGADRTGGVSGIGAGPD
ncbi:MAG: Fur family transcriptional regulator [Nakamurella sp.]